MANIKKAFIFIVLLFVPIIVSCASYNLEIEESYLDTISSPVEKTLMKRAYQMAEIKWTPVTSMPTQGGFFPSGKQNTGIPYSSVKELDKFVGQDVSFYTFITAVQNRKSVLYSENVSEPPYNGVNCSTYYGTVCSMAVNYALGIPYAYTTSSYKHLDSFYLVEPQSLDALQVGDILLQDSKHVVLVLGLKEENRRLTQILILESSGGSGTRIDGYSPSSLLKRWEKDGWELLRYKNLESIVDLQILPFNDYYVYTPFAGPICCSRGDRASFREGETVVLNNLDEKPHRLIVRKNGDEIMTLSSGPSDVSLDDLDAGIYEFEVVGESVSRPTVEIINADVSVSRKGSLLNIGFSSTNAKPQSIIISDHVGRRESVIPLLEEDIENGFKVLEMGKGYLSYYVKVIFEGAFGCVSNAPIPIQ